jgi:short subunit dehydrogenase-like uncharacterized protein
MNDELSVLIVGGYGTFGGRIVELLENEPRLVLSIAGRSLERARAYCKTREGAKARLVPTVFDREGDLAAQLASLRPHILVDASGPFQNYGQGRYRVIEACIAQGVHYLDLADGSDFVAGVEAFDPAARDAGVLVLSGVSSFPVLTAAAVRRLSAGMAKVTAIRVGLALCRRRHERDPRHRGLCRPALHAPTRRQACRRLSLYRAHALHHCAAGARAAAQHAVLARRRSRLACLG